MLVPILVTLVGIITDVMPWHDMKACEPIDRVKVINTCIDSSSGNANDGGNHNYSDVNDDDNNNDVAFVTTTMMLKDGSNDDIQ